MFLPSYAPPLPLDKKRRVGYNGSSKAKGKDTMAENTNKKKAPAVGRCEDCEFYDYDEDMDAYVCQVNLDEDEMVSFISGQTGRCPYYRYYDEYKSVHKQI